MTELIKQGAVVEKVLLHNRTGNQSDEDDGSYLELRFDDGKMVMIDCAEQDELENASRGIYQVLNSGDFIQIEDWDNAPESINLINSNPWKRIRTNKPLPNQIIELRCMEEWVSIGKMNEGGCFIIKQNDKETVDSKRPTHWREIEPQDEPEPEMEDGREIVRLTDEELEDFDFTAGYEGEVWNLRGETYKYVETIRTDEFSDGESWDIVVKRESDGRFFKWNCWDAGDYNGYIMENGENCMKEVFPETITKTVYK